MKLKQLFITAFMFVSLSVFSQGIVNGKIVDDNNGIPLSGANVVETGTSNGTISDFDGKFSLEVSNNEGSLSISYLGFLEKTVSYSITNGEVTLKPISLSQNADELTEVVVIGTGVIDLASDRKTPVAVSTIKGADIQLKATGNVEFTEAIKNTPSVYVSNQAGGFGDSQIFLRGFDQTNTAFLLNGQPINGMEDGKMYWSNWSGMSDIANAVQVQRGLGSSKLAISSVGGTVNIVSKTTDKREGGFVRFLAGNDSYFKGTVAYDTGLNENGWAFSFLVDHWQAFRKYSIGTAGQGQNYLFSIGYKPNEKHSFNFLITGAPQWHDQNFSNSLENYEQYGEKYNGNTGIRDGSRFTERRNYYHKPIANLNWDFNINDKLDLSTVLYASWGRGGGTGRLSSSSTAVRNDVGELDWDQIIDNNITNNENGIGSYESAYIMRSSVNNHNWYGLLSNLNYEYNDNWNFNIGIDGRTYTGDHFRQVSDFMGLNGYNDNFGTNRPSDYVITESFDPDPWKALFDFADDDQRVAYNYSETINYIGAFGQAEYSTDKFSAFFQGAVSNQSYQREGKFDTGENTTGKSEKVNKTGFNLKGGAAYNINDNHSFFANAGFYSRQPFLDNIFDNIRSSNELVSPGVDNEEITGFEAGYRFKNDELRVNVDVYRTEWGNRFLATYGQLEVPNGDPIEVVNRFTDITQIHKGLEADVAWRPKGSAFTLHWYGSLGNWEYNGTTPVSVLNSETNEFIPLATDNVDLTGTKIGNAPQTSTGLGLTYDILDNLSVDGTINIYEDLYGFVDVEDVIDSAVAGETYQAEKLSPYTLTDMGLTYKFNLGGKQVTFRGNVYNVFNTSYINQKDDFGYFLGIGRTFNASLRYNF